MKLRYAGIIASAVLVNTLIQADSGFLDRMKRIEKKQTNTRKAKKARWKRSITWM